MKYVKDTTGRFAQRPHYDVDELDRECEAIINKHLKSIYNEIRFPVQTDDLTKLIESEADSLDLYADLSEFGEGVEGVTEFHPGKKPKVYINKDLSQDIHRENRLRTTLTHEYGHVHYHSYLWDFESRQGYLTPDKRERRAVCKRSTILDAPQVDWMEWQAGHVCGAILMPASCVRRLIGKYVEEVKIYTPIDPESDHASHMIQLISGQFQVSKEAARIRLLRLRILGHAPATNPLF